MNSRFRGLREKIFFAGAFCVLVTVGALTGTAQTNTGTVTGQVFDFNKAVIAGAAVEITNPATNSRQNTTTTDAGNYAFASLQPGLYRLRVTREGFKTALVEAVEVLTAQTVTVDVTLEIGSVENTVQVEGDAQLLTRDSAAIATTVENKLLLDVPFPERSALGAVLIAPTVQGDPQYQGGIQSENPGVFTQPVTPGASLQVSGGRPGTSSQLVDGSDITLAGYPRAGVTFSGDTVQEVTVQQNGLPAQFGRTGGGIINQSTKSGGNRFRATLYWRHTDPGLQARAFGSAFGPQRRQNQFAFVASGPVFLPAFGEGGPFFYNGKNKSFFFVSVEPLRYSDLTYNRGRLPTPDELAGRFNNSLDLLNTTILRNQGLAAALAAPRVGAIYYQFARNAQGFPVGRPLASGQITAVPNNDLSAQLALNPAASFILSRFPTVQNPGRYAVFLRPDGLYEPDGNNALLARGVTGKDNRYSLRFDHAVAKNDQLAFRYTHVPVSGTRFNYFGPESPLNEIPQDSVKSHNATLKYTKILGGAMVNEFRVTYTRANRFRGPAAAALTEDFGARLGLRPATAGYGFPLLDVRPWNVGSGGNRTDGGTSIDENLGFANDFSLIFGNHSLKFGAETRELNLTRRDNSGLLGGGYVFRSNETANGAVGGSSLASFILGAVRQFNVRTNDESYYYTWRYFAAYAQDDWKIRPNLTLNLGLRYHLEVPRKEKNNRQGSFDPNVTGTLNGLPVTGGFVFAGQNNRPEALWETNYLGFEPRVGFAYSPRSFVTLRASYSLVHTPLSGQGNNVLPDLSVPAVSLGLANGGVNPAAYVNYITNPIGAIPAPVATDAPVLFQFPGGFLPYIDPSSDVPYVQLWSGTAQFQLKNLFFEAGYVGNKGTHLFAPQVDTNTADPETILGLVRAGANFTTRNIPNRYGLGNMTLLESLRPYQQFYNNTIDTAYDRRAGSIYHAGFVAFRQRLTRGLTVHGSYTFSKSIDDASSGSTDFVVTDIYGYPRPQNPRDFSAERSVSTYDIPHKFTAGYSFDIPVGKGRPLDTGGNKLARLLFEGWNTSGIYTRQSGFPIWIRLGNENYANNALQDIFLRPNLVPGVPVVNPNWRQDPFGLTAGGGYLNPAAFSAPVVNGQLTYGNVPRTLPYARNPVVQFFDASLAKRFRFSAERTQFVELRADFINVLNRPNFYFGSGNNDGHLLTANSPATLTANFGKLSQAAQPAGRTIHLRLKISF